MVNIQTVGSELLQFLNDSTYIPDPWESATGKTRGDWWHDDSPMGTAKYPRGQVELETSTDDAQSFGRDYEFNELPMFRIWLYVKERQKYTENSVTYKNRQMVYFFLDKIKRQIKSNINQISGAHRPRFSDIDVVGPDKHLRWIGTMLVTFAWRTK